MTIKEGDFVLLEYTGSTGGKVFDTNVEGVAKKEGAVTEGRTYQPMAVTAGKGDVIVGLDKALMGMKKGEDKKITVTPEEGYGPRDPKLIKIVPLKVFTDNKMNPYPGMPVQLDNMTAKVQSVSGGRVRVDFNHELAGRELVFDIKITDILTKDEDKVKALAGQYFAKDDIAIEMKDKKIVARPKKELLMTKEYGQAKAYFISQITGRFPDLTIEFVEEYKK